MPAYKDKAKGTWYASFYFENWTGKKEKKMKRGFKTKREALEWERTFLQQQTADLDRLSGRCLKETPADCSCNVLWLQALLLFCFHRRSVYKELHADRETGC